MLLTVLAWLKKYWYVPALVIGAFVIWILSGRKGDPGARIGAEIKAIDAAADAKRAQAEVGLVQAVVEVEQRYSDTLEKLDEEQAVQAKELKNDPQALAKFLVRAGSSSYRHRA